MRRRLALICVVAVAGLGAGYANAPTASSAPLSSARASCGAGYVSAHLSWGNKCLRAGEFCKVWNAEYRRYGFYCPATGHLKRR